MKYNFSYTNLLFLIIFCLNVILPFKAFATYPATPYAPGETLAPSCTPGSNVNCTVELSVLTLNGLTGLTQTFAIGTSGTNFNIDSTGTIHTFNLPNASAVNRGLLTSVDWSVFNSKLSSESDPLSLKISNNLSDLTNDSTARTNLGLGSVENTALSTWPGGSNLTTLGTIISGIWNGTTIDIADGGTGATTANTAFNALAPSQALNVGKFLTTDGTDTSWASILTSESDPLALKISNNLSDLTSNTTARGNLGAAESGANTDITSLGPVGAFTLTGGATSTLGTSAGDLILQSAGTSTTGNIQIGAGGAGSATPDYLALDVKSTTGDPVGGTEGYMYYNTQDNKFRCYENAGWRDCDTTGTTLQGAYNGGSTISTAGSNIAFTLNTTDQFTASGAGSVNLTPTGASSFTSGGALTFTAGASSTWSTSSGALTLDSATALNLGTTNATSVSIGKSGTVATVNGSMTIPNYIDFTSTSNPSYAEGRVFYDDNAKSLAYYNSVAGQTLNIGQENWIQVMNSTGSTILNGNAVYINGADISGVPTVALAQANNLSTSHVIGITTNDILNGDIGYITSSGFIHDLNTSSFTAGDVLYLSASTPGGFVATQPFLPNFGEVVGYVGKSDATTGIILVKLADAKVGRYTAGSVPFGDTTSGLANQDNTNLFWDNTNKRLGIGDNTPSKTFTIGDGTPGSNKFSVDGSNGNITTAGTLAVNGGIINTSGAFTINSSGANALTLDSTTTGAVNIGTSTNGKIVTIGNTTSGTALNLLSGTGNINLQSSGTGTTGNIQIGAGGAGSATPDYLALDVKSTTGDPVGGTEGYMYYNTQDNKFRCYENAGWRDCDTTGTTLQGAYNGGSTISTAGSNIAFTLNTTDQFTASGAGSVNLTPTGASSFTSGGALTFTAGASSTWSTSSGALTLDSATALNLGTTNATSVFLGRTGVTTTNNGSLTSTQTLTASNGLTQTTGALNLTATSGALTLSGLSASSVNTGANALTITSSNFNTTATGINSTAIGTTTASTGKFTTLTSTGTTDLANAGASNVTIATTGTGNVTIGNSTGTFALTSNGGLNVSTAGVLTGVASVDTVVHSATAITFAGTGTLSSGATTALTIDSGTTGALNLGTGNNAKTINLGTGTAGDAINIGTNNTVADTIILGSTLDSLTIASSGLNVSTAGALTGITSISASGAISTSNNISTTGTGTITSAGLLTASNGLTLTTGALNLTATSGALTLSGLSASSVTTSNANLTFNTGTGIVGISTDATNNTLNIGTGGGIKTVTLGSTNSTSALTLQSGTGGLNIQTQGTGGLNIGTNAVAQTITIGNTSGTATVTTAVNITAGSGTTTGGIRMTGHILTAGTVPTQSQSSGTATVSTGSTDFSGTVTSSTTSHTYVGINFSSAFANAPFCTFSPANVAAGTLIYGSTTGVYAVVSTTYLRITHPASTTASAWSYKCVGYGGADLAEVYYTNETDVSPGTVVTIDSTLSAGVKKTTSAYDNNLMGVISTEPGMILGDQAPIATDDGPMPVFLALVGRVPVNVSIENGPIIAGDYLTSSSTPGVAMKATKNGIIVGQSLTSFDGTGSNQVMMFIKNTYAPESFSVTEQQILLGDVSPKINADGTDNGLSTLVTDIQAEVARNPITIITAKITDGKQFLTDFVTARITAIRGYFDEIFTNTSHQKTLCVGEQGSETCITKDQLDELLNKTGVSAVSIPTIPNDSTSTDTISTPDSDTTTIPTTSDSTSDPVPETDTTPVVEQTPSTSDTTPVIDQTPTPDPTPASDSTTTSDSTSDPVPETDTTPVVDQTSSTSDTTPVIDQTPTPDPTPASDSTSTEVTP